MFVISLVFTLLVTFSAGEVDPHIQELYETLPTDQFIEYFNSLGLSYKITQYENATPFISGVVFDPESQNNLTVIKHTKPEGLPDNFDPRQKWSQCATISEIYDQGQCGSCWTFGTATSASDRYCTLKNMTIRLAEQDFDCLSNDVCNGYWPNEAFQYWIDVGLVTQDCKPYNIPKLQQGTCEKRCQNGQNYEADKHRGSSQSRLARHDATIRTELFRNGPIEAIIIIYEDFPTYRGGIYTHIYGAKAGTHSVRVLGYGVENGTPFWLAANSWGPGWGENGTFKIKRFIDCEFEDHMIAGFP